MSMSWGEVFSVVFTGIIVVFLALIILVFVVYVVGKIFSAIDKSKQNKEEQKKKPQISEPSKDSSRIVNEGISQDVVAAIMAAVTCMMDAEGKGKSFVIRSIKRAGSSVNLWHQAGVAENTRPF